MAADTFTFLRSLDLFRSLPEEGLRELARVCREERYESGKVVFPEGAAADCLFIIVDGEVEVWKGHGSDEAEIIAHLDKGDIFGEMALVDRLPRSATIVTSRPTGLLAVAEKDVQGIIQKSPPVALAIQSLLSQRVRRSTGRFVEDLQRKNKDLEKALEELKKVQDELISQERLSTVGRFASLILHDARQPIAAVMANAELLLRRDNLPVSAGSSGEELVFTVTDTGEGMDAETLRQIFEPFFSSSSRGGTGLGMVAVRNIVEAHGGSVTVDSSPAGGTTVHIHLPLG